MPFRHGPGRPGPVGPGGPAAGTLRHGALNGPAESVGQAILLIQRNFRLIQRVDTTGFPAGRRRAHGFPGPDERLHAPGQPADLRPVYISWLSVHNQYSYSEK